MPGLNGTRILALAYMGVAAALVLFALGIWVFGNSHAGDPVVDVALNLPSSHGSHEAPSADAHHGESASAEPHGTEAPPADAATTAEQPGQAPLTDVPANLVPNTVVTKPIYAGRALIADPGLIEQTSQGPLPRIADDGRTPMAAYAPPPTGVTGKPKIAIVITGLGFSARETSSALSKLPAAVTLAFAPYSDDAQRWVGEARKEGHEVLVEVPMEPFDFPDSDPGPHTLRTGVSEDQNTQRLMWALTRFTGYTGITNLLGSRFLSDQDSLSPTLAFLSKRGLLFYDNGSVSRSVAPAVAKRTGTAFAQGSVTIDRIQTAMEIDRRLA
ncbi:MAG TPA: divergent polysaccharide deacetylase family protein, partial [Rhizomicrobium sp.]|nr:divergent polysaccharide deacetylase family protein [Rhizomicrobium sp.]